MEVKVKKWALISILLLLHFVGILGSIYEPTRELVVSLTPINLIVSSVILLLGHQGERKGLILFFFGAFSIGLIIEIIGIQTGFPFGSYKYGDVLGPKILDTSIIIGLNWFMLSYSFGVIFNIKALKPFLSIVLASLGMVVLDLIIEPVAIGLDYWSWGDTEVPIKNYLAWFLISLILQILFRVLLSRTRNDIAKFLVISQVGYFIMILIFLII